MDDVEVDLCHNGVVRSGVYLGIATNGETKISEVKGIDTDTKRAIYESMTSDREALRLLSIGVVQAIASIVQLPCEDPSPF